MQFQVFNLIRSKGWHKLSDGGLGSEIPTKVLNILYPTRTDACTLLLTLKSGAQVRERIAASPEGGCLFANCLHVGEPSCAVGTEWDRYPYYLGLLDEVRKREEVEKRVLGTKRESDVR
jgi:hypothetical protein